MAETPLLSGFGNLLELDAMVDDFGVKFRCQRNIGPAVRIQEIEGIADQ